MGRRNRKRGAGDNPGPEPSEPHRSNVPGEWDHSSGEVEGFEASLVSGAGGEEHVVSDEELAREAQEATGRAAVRAAATGAAPGHKTRGIGRFGQFLKASWAELQRVQWPNRSQVAQGTAVVLGFVVLAGAYLGLADVVAQEVIDFIL